MVYIDDMRAKFRGFTMCHMVSDTEEELHKLAGSIGLLRKWYQGDHYDVALGKRKLAIEHGAVEITLKQCAAMCFHRRITGKLGTPDGSIDWMTNYIRKNK